MPGTIIIRPIQAKLEINDGLIKKLDPYCIASIGNTIAKSSVCKKGGKAPQWQDSLVLNRADEPYCFLQVKDRNILKDRKLGSCTIDLEDTLTSVFSQRWYELYDHERPVGEILIEAKVGRDYSHHDGIPVEHIVAQKSNRLEKRWKEKYSMQEAEGEPEVVRNITKELLMQANSSNSGGSKSSGKSNDGGSEKDIITPRVNDLYERNKALKADENIMEMDESINLVTEAREMPHIRDSVTLNASHRKFSNEFTPKKAQFVRIPQKGPGSMKKSPKIPTVTLTLENNDFASPKPQIVPVHSYQSPHITKASQRRPKFATEIRKSHDFPRKKITPKRFPHSEKKTFRALKFENGEKKISGNFLPVARTPEEKIPNQVFTWEEDDLEKEKNKYPKTLRSPLQGCSSPRVMIPKIDVKKRRQQYVDVEDKENVQNEANKEMSGPKYFGSPAEGKNKIQEAAEEHFKDTLRSYDFEGNHNGDYEKRRFSYKKERLEKKASTERKQVEVLKSLNLTPGKDVSKTLNFVSPKSEKVKLKKIAYRTYVECHDGDLEDKQEENLWDLKSGECL